MRFVGCLVGRVFNVIKISVRLFRACFIYLCVLLCLVVSLFVVALVLFLCAMSYCLPGVLVFSLSLSVSLYLIYLSPYPHVSIMFGYVLVSLSCGVVW